MKDGENWNKTQTGDGIKESEVKDGLLDEYRR